jgi:hypothetical protein
MTASRINSRGKGKTGELELASLLWREFEVRATRNLEQSRNGGCDLILSADKADGPISYLNLFSLEVKRYASPVKPSIMCDWWCQASTQAERAGKLPLLAYRYDRGEWLIRLPLQALDQRFEGQWEHHVTLPFATFSKLVWSRADL